MEVSLKIHLIILLVFLGTFGSCSKTELDNKYFLLPTSNSNVVHSEELSFVVDTVVSELNRPYSMTFLPDRGMLITERSGNLLLAKKRKIKQIGGDIPNGLRDIALHPNYSNNGWIYLTHYIEPKEGKGGQSRIIRGKLENNKLVDINSLYSAGPFQEGGEWFGSRIAFNKEGYLFFTVGQRGKRENAQNLSHYSGKIIRLTEKGNIPLDNPFVDSSGTLPAIYTYGHRQIQGLTLNPQSGNIWASEHGPMGGDEVNIIRSGLNYGWAKVTYGLNYDSTLISQDTLREGMEPPIHQWTPSIAPSGLDFVVGKRYKGWEGNLFSGSLKFRFLNRSVMEENRVVHEERLLKDIGRIRSIKFAPDKFLYIMTEDTGIVVRLVPVDSIN